MTLARSISRLLRLVVGVSCRRPVVTLAIAALLAAVSVVYALSALELKTSTTALLPPNQPYVERFKQYDKEFGELDDLIIVVEAPTLPEATAYAARLAREIRTREVPLSRLEYRIDPKYFDGRALLYLSKERLGEIRDRLFDSQEFVETFAARPTLDQLVEGIGTQMANAFATGFLDLGLDERKEPPDLRFIRDLARQVSTRLDRPAPYQSPWKALFTVGPSDEGSGGYFVSDDARLLFMLAEPSSDKGTFTNDRRAIEGVRSVIAGLKREFPTIRVGVTGKAALSNDEMTAAFRDSERATVLAFVLTLGLLIVAFIAFGKPVLMLAVLATSLCWSIGVATLVIGHLSLFSVMFISIVIGIGIDYGIYFLFRYEEEIFVGRSLREAIEITASRTGPGMLLGAATAAGAFYVLMLTDFLGLQELGFIAGTAIVLAWVSMMTVLPAVVMLVDRRHGPGRTIPRAIALERVHVPLVDRLTAWPRTILVLAGLLTLVSLWGLRGARFDYNLLHLQAKGTESVTWERRILETASRSGFTALSTADSLEELRRKVQGFRRLHSVSDVDSALMLVPEDQSAKLKIVRDFAPLVAPIRIGRPTPVDLDRMIDAFEAVARRLKIAANEAPAGPVSADLRDAADDVDHLITKLRFTDHDVSQPALTVFQNQLYRDFVRNFQRLQANLQPKPIRLGELPPELQRKFVSDKGRFLIQINPGVDIWDQKGAEQFVTELRTVDPDVTGTPIITYEAIRLMGRAYRQGTLYAILLVAGVTFLVLRRVRETALALLPLGLGMIWTVGLMYFFDLPFNLGNLFAVPLILGSAAEFGLNIVMRWIEGREHGGPLIARSTVMAVLVNGLTTCVGFGSLMLADHRGIFGLGLLLTLGSAMSLVASLVVLPVILRMLSPHAAAPVLVVAGGATNGGAAPTVRR